MPPCTHFPSSLIFIGLPSLSAFPPNSYSSFKISLGQTLGNAPVSKSSDWAKCHNDKSMAFWVPSITQWHLFPFDIKYLTTCFQLHYPADPLLPYTLPSFTSVPSSRQNVLHLFWWLSLLSWLRAENDVIFFNPGKGDFTWHSSKLGRVKCCLLYLCVCISFDLRHIYLLSVVTWQVSGLNFWLGFVKILKNLKTSYFKMQCYNQYSILF
jgi:hypothetical protein